MSDSKQRERSRRSSPPCVSSRAAGSRCAGRSRPPRSPQVDPFLLLDHMGPVDLGPGEAKGAPDHPHRGFETVTYMLDGAMEHEDSAGHAGRIGPGRRAVDDRGLPG